MQVTEHVHHYLTSAATSDFHGLPVEVLDAWQGSENLLWRVRCAGKDAVLKLYLDAGQARSRRQYDGQQSFAPQGIAPNPLWYDRYPTGLARQVLVYDWVPGEAVDFSGGDQREALAASVASIHSSDPSAVRRFCPHPINLEYFWNVLSGSIPSIHRWLAQVSAPALLNLVDQLGKEATVLVGQSLPLWQQAAPTPVHGDLLLENTLYSRGQVVLLDWEMYGLGDPALEIAKFVHAIQSSAAADHVQTWREHYLHWHSPPGLLQRIGVYLCLLPYRAVTYLLLGLPELVSGQEELAARAETVDFLAVTLKASLYQSVAAMAAQKMDFGGHAPNGELIAGAVDELFDALAIGANRYVVFTLPVDPPKDHWRQPMSYLERLCIANSMRIVALHTTSYTDGIESGWGMREDRS